MRIVQLLPGISYGDAVSNDALAIRRIIQEMGYDTGVYSQTIGSRITPDMALPLEKMGRLKEEDILLYHGALGTYLNRTVPSYPCTKVMRYHNITPPAFFYTYSNDYVDATEAGYEDMRYLSDKLDYCIADSGYNREQLLEMGYGCPVSVCPILIPLEDYRKKPDRQILERYGKDGTTNLLFVGRVAPNKKQEDIIRAFYVYRKYYNPDSRLFLVGSCDIGRYGTRLRDYVDSLGLDGKVIFTGHVRFDEILAYYRVADAFVCMSEHEGFCVPVVEAMTFHVPVVAYRSCAVPETLGQGGILLEDKDPYTAAAAIHRVTSDRALRRQSILCQKRELQRFAYETVKKRLEGILREIMAKR